MTQVPDDSGNKMFTMARSLGWTFVFATLGNVASVLVQILIVRGWGRDEHGRISALVAAVAGSLIIGTLGISSGYGTIVLSRGRFSPTGQNRFLRTAFALNLGAGLASILLYFSLRGQFNVHALVWVVCGVVTLVSRMVISAALQEKSLGFTHPLGQLVRLALVLPIFLVTFRLSLDWIWTSSWIITAGASLLAARASLSSVPQAQVGVVDEIPPVGELLQRGFPFLLHWASFNAFPVAIPLMGALLGNESTASVLQIFVVFAMVPRMISVPLRTVLVPRLARSDFVAISKMGEKLLFLLGVLGLLLSIVGLRFVLDRIFGGSYTQHANTALLMVAAGALESIGLQLDARLEVLASQKMLLVTEVLKITSFAGAVLLCSPLPVVDRLTISAWVAIGLSTLMKTFAVSESGLGAAIGSGLGVLLLALAGLSAFFGWIVLAAVLCFVAAGTVWSELRSPG